MIFTALAATVMGISRILGRSIERTVSEEKLTPQAPQATMHLADIFLMTAAIALSITVFGAQVDLLLAGEARWQVIGRSCFLLFMASLGLVALTRNGRVYRLAAALAIALAVYGIVDIALHVALVPFRATYWYQVMNLVRYPLFLSLVTFAFASMMRAAGYRWGTPKPVGASPTGL